MKKLVVMCLLCISIPMMAAPQNSTGASKSTAPAKTTKATKAVIDTTAGKISCTLFPDKAPLTVENFAALSTGTKDWTDPMNGTKRHGVPLYDGTIFHRVIPGFMIQGGDPTGTGRGDPGYKFQDEFSDLTFDKPGRLAMANSGPNTNGSQFFITVAPTPWLNGHHTIFGQCENADVVDKIVNAPTSAGNRPVNPVKINHITISK